MTVKRRQPVKKVLEKQGTLEVTSTIIRSKENESKTEKGKKIRIRPFVTDTANVSVKLGATVNMGDYSSARVDVMLSVPCYVEEMLTVYKQAREFASELVTEEIDRLTGDGDE